MAILPLLMMPLLVFVVPDPALPHAGWVGKTVFVKKIGIKLHSVDDQGQLIPLMNLTSLEYTVLEETPERVQIKTRQGLVGWVKKSEVVLFEEAIPFFSQQIMENPENSDLFNRRAWAWKKKGELRAAIDDLTEALRLRQDPALYNNRAIVWQTQKNYDRALEDYSQALRLHPGYALPYCNRGILRNLRQEYDLAIEDFTAALQIDPKYLHAYRNRGHAWKGKNDHDRAMADYSEVLRLDPRSALAHHDRGMCWQAKKDDEKAHADYSAALDLDPAFLPARLERGLLGIRRKSYERALKDLDQVLRLEPHHPRACAAAALLLATCPREAIRDGQRALALSQQALERHPDEPALQQALAAAHAERGHYREAVQIQEQALRDERLKNDAEARRRLETYRRGQPFRQQ